jgi:hypothetical protein
MDEPASDPGRQVIVRAFEIAAETGERCRPIHVLAALTEIESSVRAALTSMLGDSFPPRRASPPPRRGGRASFLVMQTQEAAGRLASDRGEIANAAHLLLALADRGDEEIFEALNQVGLDLAAFRLIALEALRAPGYLPPISMPPLTPAGTLDRPPLFIDDLNLRAWSALCWRQDHLPLREIKRPGDYHSLRRLEARAAWRVASRLQLDEDQRYSLLRHHIDQVERLVARSTPQFVELRAEEPRFVSSGVATVQNRRRMGRTMWLSFMTGWGSWIANRRVGLRNRWFQFRTQSYFRHSPQL